MSDSAKTKKQLVEELRALRQEVAALRDAEAVHLRSAQLARESEANWRRLADNAPDVLFRVELTPSVRCSYISRAVTRVLGYSPEELSDTPGMPWALIHPRDRVLLRDMAWESGEHAVIARWRRKDGHIVWISLRSTPVRDEEDRVLAIEGLARDITEPMHAEDALRKSERRYRELADLLPQTVFELDVTGRFTFVNRAGFEHFGYSEEDFRRGVAMPQTLIPGDQERAAANMADLLAGRPPRSAEYTAQRKDGSTFPCVVYSTPIIRDGRSVGLRGFLIDITARKEAELSLLRVQKLEAAGRVARQVAHDFNNLLGPLALYPDLIRAQLPEGHPAADYCATMLKAVLQMAEINSDMLAFARSGHVSKEPTDLNGLVAQALGQRDSLPSSLRIHLDLRPDLPTVVGSPLQLLRVVSNLMSNARQAMHDSGDLRVETDNVRFETPLDGGGRAGPGEYVRLRVADTGPGIPAEIRDKIFEPFFTTRMEDTRRGLGLGLSIVQAVVEDHQGHVDVESEEGRGACFTVYLPASTERAKVPEATPTRGGERILVADDDRL